MNRRHEGPNGRSEEGGGGGEVSLGHGGGLGCVSPGTCAPSPFIPAGREADCLGVAVRLERCLCVLCERGVTAEQGSDGLSHRARPWAQAGGPSEEQGGFRGRIIGSQPAWVWRDLTAPQLWVGCPHRLTLPGAPSVPGLRATSSPMQPDFRTPSAAEVHPDPTTSAFHAFLWHSQSFSLSSLTDASLGGASWPGSAPAPPCTTLSLWPPQPRRRWLVSGRRTPNPAVLCPLTSPFTSGRCPWPCPSRTAAPALLSA